MAKGRNEQCRCGSGKKVKRCCGLRRGPTTAQLAQAFLAEERRRAAAVVVGIDRDELDEVFEKVVELAMVDASLQVELPRLLPPELERLRAAVADDDQDEFEAARPRALALFDTAEQRAALARAVLEARDEGRTDRRVAAVAVIDLAAQEGSALLASSLTQALAVSVGAARTPAGLIVMSR